MRKIRFVIIGFILILAAWFMIARIQSTKAQAAKIETAKISQKDLVDQVSASGQISAKRLVNLSFQSGGHLAWVGVKEGDTVVAYQAIASLDTRSLKKTLEKSLRDYSKTRNTFEEDRLLTYKDQVFTDTIKRILEKNQWDLEKAVLDVELNDITLEFATLISPISGIITHIDTPVAGVNVTTASIFTIADPQSLIFKANIDETDVGKLELGQTAEVSLDAYPQKKFTGVVNLISFATETTSGGATIVPVEIALTDFTDLRLGLNGDVAITLKQIPQTLAVLSEAIKESETCKYVVQKVDGKYQKTPVKTGLVTESDTEISEGLKAGDEVVIKGFQYLPKSLQK